MQRKVQTVGILNNTSLGSLIFDQMQDSSAF